MAKEDLEKEIEALKRQKDELIESYREKTDKFKQETLSAEKKFKTADDLFKQAFAERFVILEKTEKEQKEHSNALDLRERELGIQKNELAKEKASLQASQKDFGKVVDEHLIVVNAKSEEIESQRKRNLAILEENKGILEKIKSRQEKLHEIEKDFLQKKKEFEVSKQDFKGKEDKFEEEKKKVQMKEQELSAIESNSLQKDKELRDLQENTNVLADKLKKEAQTLVIEKETVQKEINESREFLRQIESEKTKISIDRIANLAREKRLNEKERSLNEREQNLKTLEAKV